MPRYKKSIAFYLECWGVGGIETCTLNLIRRLAARGWSISLFAVYSVSDIFDEELRRLRVPLYVVFPRRTPSIFKRSLVGPREWGRYLASLRPWAVHIQTMSGLGFLYGEIARRQGVTIRVIHSHNSDVGEGGKALKRALHYAYRAMYGSSATLRLACSNSAGRFMFGTEKFLVAKNGINIERFAFDGRRRNRFREELGLSEEALLVGNPSRVAPAKNPLFQLRVVKSLADKNLDFRYVMLTGDGELENEVETCLLREGLEKRVIRLAPRPDVESVYCALDVMLFPSLFEGLGKVAIEAQCSGLPVVASYAVPEEACITDCLVRMSLEKGEDAWARAVLDASAVKHDRARYAELVAQAGYDEGEALDEVVDAYESFYRHDSAAGEA